MNINETIFRYFNSFAGRSELIDGFIIFGAETLGLVLLFGLVAFLFSHEHSRQGFHNVIIVLGAAFAAWAASELISMVYPYPRPFLALDGVTKLIAHGGMDALPSGHATFFFAIATALYFYHKKIALFYALGALAIGASRIAAGIHWPLDILVGYILGGIVATFVYILYYHYVLARK